MTAPEREKLLALAARCEAADCGDALIDKAIAEALGWRLVVQTHDDDLEDFDWQAPNGSLQPWPPFYSRSLDAAMTLAAGREAWKLEHWRDLITGRDIFEAWAAYAPRVSAASPALAMCAAALRALAQEPR